MTRQASYYNFANDIHDVYKQEEIDININEIIK